MGFLLTGLIQSAYQSASSVFNPAVSIVQDKVGHIGDFISPPKAESKQAGVERQHPDVNTTPPSIADINSNPRDVWIAYREVGYSDYKSYLQISKSLLGWSLDNRGPTNIPPNLICHWCVSVGDYLHQLQATGSSGWNYYDNQKINIHDGAWALYKVGTTRFNDEAIRLAAKDAIRDMPEQYHYQKNNCQTFTVKLLDRICREGREKVVTSYSNGKLMIGAAQIPDDTPPAEKETIEMPTVVDEDDHYDFLAKVQKEMNEKAPKFSEQEIAQTADKE
ncbi:hypothetical protein MMC26_006226 [Xylographa opegraphella]|nr:hypothetical protein [Xylographa opegraphella]